MATMTSERRRFLGLTLAVAPLVLLGACGPNETEETPTEPTLTPAVQNITDPRGLDEHGVQVIESGDDAARAVAESLMVRDGTPVADVVDHLVAEGLLAEGADVVLDAPGLDGIVDTTFRSGKVVTLTAESSAGRYGELPDTPEVVERSVSLTFEGIPADDPESNNPRRYEATIYTVVTKSDQGFWQVSAVRVLRFSQASD